MKNILKEFGRSTVRAVDKMYDDKFHDDLILETERLINEKYVRKILDMYQNKYDHKYLVVQDIVGNLRADYETE